MSNKTFFTYEQQIEKLTKEKQLVISDIEFAKDTLLGSGEIDHPESLRIDQLQPLRISQF